MAFGVAKIRDGLVSGGEQRRRLLTMTITAKQRSISWSARADQAEVDYHRPPLQS